MMTSRHYAVSSRRGLHPPKSVLRIVLTLCISSVEIVGQNNLMTPVSCQREGTKENSCARCINARGSGRAADANEFEWTPIGENS